MLCISSLPFYLKILSYSSILFGFYESVNLHVTHRFALACLFSLFYLATSAVVRRRSLILFLIPSFVHAGYLLVAPFLYLLSPPPFPPLPRLKFSFLRSAIFSKISKILIIFLLIFVGYQVYVLIGQNNIDIVLGKLHYVRFLSPLVIPSLLLSSFIVVLRYTNYKLFDIAVFNAFRSIKFIIVVFTAFVFIYLDPDILYRSIH